MSVTILDKEPSYFLEVLLFVKNLIKLQFIYKKNLEYEVQNHFGIGTIQTEMRQTA